MDSFKDTHTPIGVVSPSHELLQRTTTKDEAKDKQLTADVKGKNYCRLYSLALILSVMHLNEQNILRLF